VLLTDHWPKMSHPPKSAHAARRVAASQDLRHLGLNRSLF
jgi:hypothetical protein